MLIISKQELALRAFSNKDFRLKLLSYFSGLQFMLPFCPQNNILC